MNLEHYRHRLLSEQHEASSRLERAIAGAREASARLPHDSADEGAVAALKDQLFAQADAARQLLDQVRGALDRIENGTFGLCAEDASRSMRLGSRRSPGQRSATSMIGD